MTKIITHDGLFHADEITACALWQVFIGEISIQRVSHEFKDFSKADIVLDIGCKYDGVKFFDHHQNKGGKASSGLIWDYIISTTDDMLHYSNISRMIKMIDANDVGEKRSEEFEIPRIISNYNHPDIYGEEQDKQFLEAVEVMSTILLSMKRSVENIIKARTIVNESTFFHGNPEVIKLKEFTPLWAKIINGSNEKYKTVEAVVWYDEAQRKWKTKTTALVPGSFKNVGKSFLPNDNMDFVHSAGFFAVCRTEEQMKSFFGITS